MTPTELRPSECKHWLMGYCQLNVDFCYVCGCITNYCPDYEPKEKKDNDSRTTKNN